MASKRQIFVGGVPIGGGAPVAVQTMTKTETANLAATMEQIRTVADAGADIVRVAVPRDEDVEALKTIVKESPIPVIADIHFNHTLALKAIDAGAHCIRLNPGNIGGREKVAEVAVKAPRPNVPMRIGVNSGSLPKHLHELERTSPVEALVAAAVEFVELMEGLDFENFKVSIESTNVPNTIAANRLLSEKIVFGDVGRLDRDLEVGEVQPLHQLHELDGRGDEHLDRARTSAWSARERPGVDADPHRRARRGSPARRPRRPFGPPMMPGLRRMQWAPASIALSASV